MLALAQREHGRLAWSSLFADAERTAREGFAVSPRLARFVNGNAWQTRAPDVRAYFSKPDGSLVQAGDRLRNPAYAEFLGRLAVEGTDALYRGPTAARIVARVHEGELAGTMTLDDLAGYRPVKRDSLCRAWRLYLLCVPPPPSSGVGLLELMLILEQTDIAGRGPDDPQAWYLFAEASRLMYADRDLYVGDADFVR
jgi:gamma-glutamyltranspeptidase/glutathione hydrolase